MSRKKGLDINFNDNGDTHIESTPIVYLLVRREIKNKSIFSYIWLLMKHITMTILLQHSAYQTVTSDNLANSNLEFK